MELFLLAGLVVIAAWMFKSRDQRRRVALLATYFASYQIEKHMETLTQGYLRGLDAGDPERSEPIWSICVPPNRNYAASSSALPPISRAPMRPTRA